MDTPVDIQAKLDQWLESNADAQKYVTKMYYIQEGHPIPEDVTHTFALTSAQSYERHLLIGLVTVPQYGTMLDAFLALLATQPSDR